MSIIYDALKKVQTDLKGAPSKKDPAAASQPAASAPQPVAPVSSQNILKPAAQQEKTAPTGEKGPNLTLIISGSFVCLLLAAALILLPRHFPKSSASPAPPSSSDDAIVVKGIMARGDKNLALINDGIYELGDTVFGMKITEITPDQVRVAKDGEISVLKVNQNKKLSSR